MDARLAIKKLFLPKLTPPKAPYKDKDRTLNRLWEKEVDEHVKRKTHLADNMQTVYSLAWGQCTDCMRHKLEALPIQEELTNDGDGVVFLNSITNLIDNFQSQKYL